MRLVDADPTLLNRPDFGSGVSNRARALRERAIADLSLGELAFCLRQGMAVPQVAARAVEALAVQPLLVAEGYPGDLLWSLLHAASQTTLPQNIENELWEICSAALAGAESIRETVVPAASAFIAQRLGT